MDSNNFPFLEISFNNLLKYLLFSNIISRNFSCWEKMQNILNTLECEDSFIELFNSLMNFYDVENTWELVNKCVNFMKKDYFLNAYVQKFIDVCSDLILERVILVQNRIYFE